MYCFVYLAVFWLASITTGPFSFRPFVLGWQTFPASVAVHSGCFPRLSGYLEANYFKGWSQKAFCFTKRVNKKHLTRSWIENQIVITRACALFWYRTFFFFFFCIHSKSFTNNYQPLLHFSSKVGLPVYLHAVRGEWIIVAAYFLGYFSDSVLRFSVLSLKRYKIHPDWAPFTVGNISSRIFQEGHTVQYSTTQLHTLAP